MRPATRFVDAAQFALAWKATERIGSGFMMLLVGKFAIMCSPLALRESTVTNLWMSFDLSHNVVPSVPKLGNPSSTAGVERRNSRVNVEIKSIRYIAR